MNKLTKIVATIGPATETAEILEQLMTAGMDVARFNTKHNTVEWHHEIIERTRKVAKKMDKAVGILLDLQGPEIRIDLPEEKNFEMKKDETITLTSDTSKNDGKTVHIPNNVIGSLQEGNLILFEDGYCEFEVTGKGDDYLTAKALGDFTVKHRKTMNTPGITIDMPSLVEKDFAHLDGMAKTKVDFVGLSFVRDKNDIDILREELKKRNLEKVSIVAKVENQSALDNLDEIIEASDAVMVARGDLAVEVPFEQLAFWQKLIISKCRMAAKPVITATQMLKSMVSEPRPTRAEVSDVANAVFDSTSAVMLSDETTIGKYPVKAVETQAKIAAFNEQYVESYLEDWIEENDASYTTQAAAYLMQHRDEELDGVICLTESGDTVTLLSRFRPKVPIYAVTSNEATYHRLTLNYAVDPYIVEFPEGKVEEPNKLTKILKDKNIVKKGEKLLVIYGSIWKSPGLTNTVSIVHVE